MRQTVDKPESVELNQVNLAKEIKQEKQKYFRIPFMKNGHKMFEINPETQMVDVAKLTEPTLDFMNPNKKSVRNIIATPGCFYLAALNEANAIKRYAKIQNAKFKK